MAAGRSVTFLLMLLLLFATWISFAQASQGGIPVSSTEMGLLDDETGAPTSSKNWVGGRKMVVINRKMKVTMRGSVGGSTSKFTSTSSNCGNRDLASCEEQSVNHFFSDEVLEDHESAGFVAFNADYHEPRHHPPKNN